MNELILSNPDLEIIAADPETGDLVVTKEVINAIKQNEQIRREVKAFDTEFKARLKEAMEQHNIDKIESDELVVSYVAEHEQTRLDGEAVKSKDPTLYYDCLKESTVKASVRVRLR